MTRFEETNGRIHSTVGHPVGYYATCSARNCTWVGPIRTTVAAAKRDAVRHHNDDSTY